MKLVEVLGSSAVSAHYPPCLSPHPAGRVWTFPSEVLLESTRTMLCGGKRGIELVLWKYIRAAVECALRRRQLPHTQPPEELVYLDRVGLREVACFVQLF